MSSSSGLVVEGLSAAWDGVPVLTHVSLEVRPGEFVVLMGPNGSGKSTLLRCLAGLERPTAGRVTLGGRSLDGVPTHRRGVGLLFQEPALFPHRSVWQNVAYAPQLQRISAAEVDARVREVSELLHLSDLLERAPSALSGGERQRVALARTLAARPAVVLLDEPFAAVDPELRAELRGDFRQALAQSGVPVLHVTHDREEGLFLGDRVVLLEDGEVSQSGTPQEVYGHPAGPSVARFLGYNVVPSDDQLLAVAPRDLEIDTAATTGPSARVLAAGVSAGERIVLLATPGGDRLESRGGPVDALPSPGTAVRFRWTRAIALPRGPEARR